jgi:hypothetical protein
MVTSLVESVVVAVTTVVRSMKGVCSTTAWTLVPKMPAAWNPFTATATIPSFVPPNSTLALRPLVSRSAKPSSADGLDGVGETMLPAMSPYHL